MISSAAVEVDFWFDPSCPFTWITSGWQRRLDHAPAKVNWRLMSLAILNADADISDEYRTIMAQTVAPLRVLAAASVLDDGRTLGRLYAAIGRRRHDERRPYNHALFAEALRECALDPALAGAADDVRWDEVVAADHRAAQDSVGVPSGSPITAFDGQPGFFGPVLAAAPSDEDSHRLLTACRTLATIGPLAELTRARIAR